MTNQRATEKITGFIDPPGAFDPRSAWEAFLVEMKELPPAPDVAAAIAQAEEWLEANPGDDEEDDFGDLED